MPSRKALRMMCKGSERLPSNALPAWSPLWKQLGRIQDAQEKSVHRFCWVGPSDPHPLPYSPGHRKPVAPSTAGNPNLWDLMI